MATTNSAKAIWDEAIEAEASELACRFDRAWKNSKPGRRPVPSDFLDVETSSQPASLLALLKVEIIHRHRTGEALPIEHYRRHHPELTGDALVALIYEDFCLREEAGATPDIGDFLGRFPEVAGRLREVLEIHELVAEPGSTSLDRDCHAIPFPEVGQTIAGFHLVEELGRGSFARVFLAHERQLGDRPVALKVSRTGSREPQTLARLQHTHIVPVHSYRVDPTTGLHLLCMPFFGRTTLARLLADPVVLQPGSGSDLVEALDRSDSSGGNSGVPTSARANLSSRNFPRAVAWWGARLAEGLQHAHDRGVLHRDVKPSNVLIAADGMPMLLDFNLAREAEIESVTPERLGGTIAYMAPEHLEALVEGDDRGIDHRADIYALGMVLSEALGVKPPTGPSAATTIVDRLNWLLDDRRLDVPRLSESWVAIPESLESVIRRCLAPDPTDRYSSAADLATDLQAVADDSTLRFAVEPWQPRARRWFRDYRLQLAVATPAVVAVVAIVLLSFRSQAERLRQEASARELIHDGIRAADLHQYQAAEALFSRATNLLANRADLEALRDESRRRFEGAAAASRIRDRTERFFAAAEPLRFKLLGYEKNRGETFDQLARALQPFDVGAENSWIERLAREPLDEDRKSRLVREVDDLLFFAVVRLAIDSRKPGQSNKEALDYCDKALQFSDRPGPWRALRDWWVNPGSKTPELPANPAEEWSAAACFRWYLVGSLASTAELSLTWLERAVQLEPSNFWHQFALAFEHDTHGRPDRALPACNAAVALRPGSPWAWKVRSRLHRKLGEWSQAIADLDRALEVSRRIDEISRVRLDRARLSQEIGDFRAARRDVEAVLAGGAEPWLARDARRNLARLDADRGFDSQALRRYNQLIVTDRDDSLSRRGRVRLQLRRGDPASAEADLSALLATAEPLDRAAYLAERAVARLVQDRPIEAEADAVEAFRIAPTTALSRLVDRSRLAAGRDPQSWPDDPSAFDTWPDGGVALQTDLRSAALRQQVRISDGENGIESRIVGSILLSAANDHERAIQEVNNLSLVIPVPLRVRKVRAAILARAGRLDEAMKEIVAGLGSDPENPEFLSARGKIRVRRGEFAAGLLDLKIAAARGTIGVNEPFMAEALDGLGRHAESAEVWSRWLENEPNDVRGWLGLSLARRSLHEWDRALHALEAAAGLIDDRSPLLGEVALGYIACLPTRPDRWPRLIDFGRRMISGVIRGE